MTNLTNKNKPYTYTPFAIRKFVGILLFLFSFSLPAQVFISQGTIVIGLENLDNETLKINSQNISAIHIGEGTRLIYIHPDSLSEILPKPIPSTKKVQVAKLTKTDEEQKHVEVLPSTNKKPEPERIKVFEKSQVPNSILVGNYNCQRAVTPNYFKQKLEEVKDQVLLITLEGNLNFHTDFHINLLSDKRKKFSSKELARPPTCFI